jgi:hypothetical protein
MSANLIFCGRADADMAYDPAELIDFVTPLQIDGHGPNTT